VYVFILHGEVLIDNQILHARDGFGIWNTQKIKIKANSRSEFLLMDVPMAFSTLDEVLK
jgi:quercetin 2,3-dioxygenase